MERYTFTVETPPGKHNERVIVGQGIIQKSRKAAGVTTGERQTGTQQSNAEAVTTVPCDSTSDDTTEEDLLLWWFLTCPPEPLSMYLLTEDESYAQKFNLFYQDAEPSPHVTRRLLRRVSQAGLCAIACSPDTALPLLMILAEDDDLYVRGQVAENTTVPASLLAQLAEDESYYVRVRVAQSFNTAEETLTYLAEDKNVWVKKNVARNLHTPPQTLQLLIRQKPLWPVRQNIAKNLNAPAAVLTTLADDEEPLVRLAVATNPNTPEEVLHRLTKDTQKYIRTEASETLTERLSC